MSPVAGSVSSPPPWSLNAMPPGSSRATSAAVADGTSLTRNSEVAAKHDAVAESTAARTRAGRMEGFLSAKPSRAARLSVNLLRTPEVVRIDAARAARRTGVVPPRDNFLEGVAVGRSRLALGLPARLVVPARRLRERTGVGARVGR